MRKIAQILLIAGMVMIGMLAGAVVGYAAPFAYVPNFWTDSVLVIDQATNKIARTIEVGRGPVGVAVNAAGSRVYVTNGVSDTVSVIDGVTQTVIGSPIAVGAYPEGIVVNPSGSTVYVANGGNNSISVINTATNTVDDTIPDVPATSLAIDPSGNRLYVTRLFGELTVIDTATRTIVGTPLSFTVGLQFMAMNPTGTHLYVGNHSHSVYVIRTADLEVTEIPIGARIQGVAIHPSGSFVYVAGYLSGNPIYVVDAGTNAVIGSVELGEYIARGISFNSDGTRAYVAQDVGVKVIDTSAHTVIDTIEAGSGFGIIYGQFVAPNRHIWSGTTSFPIKFTTLGGDGKFVKETGEFTGRVIETRSQGKYSLLFLSDDLLSSIYLNDVTFLVTDVDGSRSEKVMLAGTGTYYFHDGGEVISGIAQFNGTGTLKRDGPGGNFTSATIKGTVAGGKLPDVGFAGQYFTGAVKATLDAQ